MKDRVLHIIRVAGPITLGEIARLPGMTRREAEAAVEELRLEGEPIVGGNDGLRLTNDPDELAKYLEGRRRRAASIHRGTMSMRRTLRRMTAPTPSLWPDL